MNPVKVTHHAKCSDPNCLCQRLTSEYNFGDPPKPQEQMSFIPPSHKANLFYRILTAVLPSLISLQLFFNIRQVCIDEIKKVISCGDPKKGGSFLACPCCGASKFVPFTCKSRFCPSCGNLYNMQRLVSESTVLLDFPHFHITFTTDDSLRKWFLSDRLALNDLFDATRDTLLDYYKNGHQNYDSSQTSERVKKKRRKKKAGKKKAKAHLTNEYIPGIVLVMHTFGRDLKWNPHVHVLCTQGAADRHGFWHNFSFIDYKYLHIVFMQKLISYLRKRFKGNKKFHKLSSQIYKDHPEGFHVHVDRIDKAVSDKEANTPLKKTIKYIGRYLGRPPIAMSRIDSFDEGSFLVTFHYTPHEPHEELMPGEPMFETLHMLCFALRLIRHIPDPQFKMIRYAGLYSSTGSKILPKHFVDLHLLFKQKSRPKQVLFSHWRGAYYRAFHIDPVACPKCNTLMELIYIRAGNRKHYVNKPYSHIHWSDYKKSV